MYIENQETNEIAVSNFPLYINPYTIKLDKYDGKVGDKIKINIFPNILNTRKYPLDLKLDKVSVSLKKITSNIFEFTVPKKESKKNDTVCVNLVEIRQEISNIEVFKYK